MNKINFIPAFLFLIPAALSAQAQPLSDTLAVNSIRARAQSNGAFFLGGTSGEFLVPAAPDAPPSISTIKSAGLWLGGKDPSGNLRLSAQRYNDNGQTDFYPGLLRYDGLPDPDFNLIAHVTQAQIQAHLANPFEPTAPVYGWPGRGNPHFFQYHGFDLPFTPESVAPFYDEFGNGNYDPSLGDYPAIEVRGCPLKFDVDEDLWFSFHDVGPHTQSGGEPLHLEIHAQMFGYDCPEGSPANRTVYVAYKLINRDTVPLDSAYFGLFVDFEIGNGADDFIGCDTARHVVFAYNGDDTDEGGFENTPPVMAVDLLRGPYDPETGAEVDAWHFVPVDDAALTAPQAYYNLLAGRQTDGTPFPNNGLMYPGDPLNPAAWSEAGAGNTPGERKALASFGPFTLLPGAVNEIIVGYAWMRKAPDGGVAENLSILGPTMDAVQFAFDLCFDLDFLGGCPPSVSASQPVDENRLAVSPNPFTDWIRVESKGAPLQSVALFDALGRTVITSVLNGATGTTLQTDHLRPGLYGLQVRTADGRSRTVKLLRG